MYLYTAGGTSLSAVVPSWAAEGGNAKLMERLKDPAIRARLKNEIKTGAPGWWNIVEASGGWDNIVMVEGGSKDNERFVNKSIGQIAKEWNKDPADAAFDLILQANGQAGALYYLISDGDIETAVKFPWTSLGSDSAVSPRTIDPNTVGSGHPRGYGNAPRLIAEYVRKKSVISLPEAIRKLSGWPATRLHIASRGFIKEGCWADVVIFDYDKIQDNSTYEHPFVYPSGIDYVLVNGQVAIDHGKHTGAKSGMVIYGPGRQTN
jgi:N-acyl-D-aspartate/D-glutamate deacylase